MIKSLFKRAVRNGSTTIWAVSLNHILWGWYFLSHELPLPFGGIHAFSDVSMQQFWGWTFIAVALCSMLSDFGKGIVGLSLLIPQQLIVLYGAVEIALALMGDPSQRLILASCWVFPLAAMHTISVITRYARERHGEIVKKIEKLTE